MKNKPKLLLTGDQGFLASRFYDYYRDKYDFIRLNRHNLDMTDEAKVYRLFKEENIDIVFHAAAIADIGVCQDNPELARRTNLAATINIAQGCALKNTVMVFTSSDQVFSGNQVLSSDQVFSGNQVFGNDQVFNGNQVLGGDQVLSGAQVLSGDQIFSGNAARLTKGSAIAAGPYTEEDRPLPGNVYAETKLAAEQAIAAVTERFYNLRLTWMFSLLERGKKTNGGIILNLMDALFNNKPVSLNDSDFRGITYVYEVIENFEKIIELPPGTYHTGSENALSVYAIGEIILKMLNLSHRAEAILHRGSGQRRDLRISNQKLRTGGVTFSDTEQAIRRCLTDFGRLR